MVIKQIHNQLGRLVPVHQVIDLTLIAGRDDDSEPLERELALVKVQGNGGKRLEALRLADAFDAQVVDATVEHLVFEVTGTSSKIKRFVSIMQPLGIVEVARTGVAALARGLSSV